VTCSLATDISSDQQSSQTLLESHHYKDERDRDYYIYLVCHLCNSLHHPPIYSYPGRSLPLAKKAATMKFSVQALALSLATLAAAQWDQESKPFKLVLVSKDPKISGQGLAACHTGAAIESLCLTNSSSTSKPDPIAPVTFRFNTSSQAQVPDPALGAPGILTYSLPAQPPIPSSLQFYYDPTTNYALPLLFPGSGADTQTLAFDNKNLLNVQGYVDYKVNPPKAGETKAYYRWYACTTYFIGYEYVDLVWGLGDKAPETPGCVKVDVKRVFV